MTKNTVFMGIDPGKEGFIVLYNKQTGEREFLQMPLKDVPTGEFKKNGDPKTTQEFDAFGFRKLILDIAAKYQGCKFYGVIEDVIGRQGWSAQNNFNFGHTAGLQLMILIMLNATYEMVRPQKWQSIIYRGYNKVMVPSSTGKTMIHDTKATSKIVAKAIAPEIDFRKTTRSTKMDDNKTDAFLMCEYARLHLYKDA